MGQPREPNPSKAFFGPEPTRSKSFYEAEPIQSKSFFGAEPKSSITFIGTKQRERNIESPERHPSPPPHNEKLRKVIKKEKRKPKQVTACEHTDKPFYAKGFCQACYHAYGRTKLANKCEHTDRPNHALGLCKNCYFSQFARKKRQEMKKNIVKTQSAA
jgi:hypothetical protein